MTGSLLPKHVIDKEKTTIKNRLSRANSNHSKDRVSNLKSNTLLDEYSGAPSILHEIRSSNLNTLILVDRFQHKLKQRRNIAKDEKGIFYSDLYRKTKLMRTVLILFSLAIIFITKPTWCELKSDISVIHYKPRTIAALTCKATSISLNTTPICRRISHS
jgi:hypothetical protein